MVTFENYKHSDDRRVERTDNNIEITDIDLTETEVPAVLRVNLTENIPRVEMTVKDVHEEEKVLKSKNPFLGLALYAAEEIEEG